MFRPLTTTAQDTLEVIKEIETASGLRFTGIVNNSNLGEETTAQTVLSSVSLCKEILPSSRGLPIVMTTVKKKLYPRAAEK